MRERLLIVDDEPNITKSFSDLLRDQGYATDTATTLSDALAVCRSRTFDLILLDLSFPEGSGLDLLRADVLTDATVVLVVSGQSDIPTALEAVRLGAVDYLEKPVAPERLLASVRSALLLARARRQQTLAFEELASQARMVGESPAIKKLLRSIQQAAASDATVLITGDNGTGKELVAARLHLESGRRDRPFVKVNCPGIPETLFESELFGHRKGAFTGAVRDYPGKFVMADGGTIFLDEIGDLPLTCQAKLLRVLETGEVETLGETTTRVVDVRVICATNQDLNALVTQRRFRQDLFFRISVLPIRAPSLAERRDDIPLLIGAFLSQFDPGGTTHLSPDAMGQLCAQPYPGNVRQLKNIIERLTILHRGRIITAADLESPMAPGEHAQPRASAEPVSLAEHMERCERQIIEQTLGACHGNISEAARLLRIDRANLSRKARKYHITTE